MAKKPDPTICTTCGHAVGEHGKQGCKHTYLLGLTRCSCEVTPWR